MTKFTQFRVGKAGNLFQHKPAKRASASCNTGGFYKSPASGDSIEYTSPLNISWDTSCMTATAVDIYLMAPSAETPRIHAWQNVYFAAGSYQTQLEPKWWNSTSSIDMQLTIVPTGLPMYAATMPAGPIFTATYTAPSGSTPDAADTSKPDGAVTVVHNIPSTHHGLAGGKVAAAVLMPLLFVIALIVGAYLKIKRERNKEKRKRWSEAIDKRMSTISTDWKSITPAGASAAIRNSMAVGEAGNRASSFSFGGIRPSSVVADGGQAGIGARTVFPGVSGGEDAPVMAQLRPGARVGYGDRVSRVSFAPDVRDSRRTVTSRAFHTGYVPPLPTRSDTSASDDGTLSPTQTSGPLTLSAEDIQDRLSGKDAAPRPSVDEVMPALRMMRTGDAPGSPELLFSSTPGETTPTMITYPTPPTPTHAPLVPASSMSSFMPMSAPVNAMSPDAMLRAYAKRGNGPAPPPAAYGGATTPGMRTVYSPTSHGVFAQAQDQYNNRATDGSRYSVFSEEDAYGGTH
ncbi:hypothetical protein FA95DRAFT_1604665 [Auriscalpium vulgare]|uniref:Uncharacterized protein n=1 Tax=Auriscalpium vulgare TaxID=40419 RepID=A0ACB8RXY5_9AGAM|nr:hypothetical protein FA95DRAFT_1604665 [Auriscalpium vulgare]